MVDKNKYWTTVFFVFVLGSVSQLAMSQLMQHRSEIHSFHDFLYQTWSLVKTLRLDLTGLAQIWQFVGSGVGLAGIFCWLFERWLWKIPLLQGWFVLLPCIQGTWTGLLEPKTKAMQVGQVSTGDSLWWKPKNILPMQVIIIHRFDQIIYTARHPNSTNTTWATNLTHNETSDEIFLYVVYRNTPDDPAGENAAEHDGCIKIKLEKPAKEQSTSMQWQLKGKYWTDKPRRNSESLSKENAQIDRGSWGTIKLRWKSKELLAAPDWTKPEDFA